METCRLNDRKSRNRRKPEPMITSLTECGSVSLGAEMAGTSHLMSAQLGWARVRGDSAGAGIPLGAI